MSDLSRVDLLGLVPFRRASWREDGDRIVVEVPRPTRRGLRGLVDRCGWWMGPRQVRLDERGSVLWRQVDGSRDVRDLARFLRAAFPDDDEQIVPRVGAWIRALRAQSLIGYRGWDEAPPAGERRDG